MDALRRLSWMRFLLWPLELGCVEPADFSSSTPTRLQKPNIDGSCSCAPDVPCSFQTSTGRPCCRAQPEEPEWRKRVGVPWCEEP